MADYPLVDISTIQPRVFLSLPDYTSFPPGAGQRLVCGDLATKSGVLHASPKTSSLSSAPPGHVNTALARNHFLTNFVSSSLRLNKATTVLLSLILLGTAYNYLSPKDYILASTALSFASTRGCVDLSEEVEKLQSTQGLSENQNLNQLISTVLIDAGNANHRFCLSQVLGLAVTASTAAAVSESSACATHANWAAPCRRARRRRKVHQVPLNGADAVAKLAIYDAYQSNQIS